VQAYKSPDGLLDPQKDNLAASTLRICRSVPSYYKKEQLAGQYIYLLGRYIALPYPEVRNYGSGGLRSNLEDLSHYLIAYMNGGEYHGGKILKNDTIIFV
jgi:CubicO group peptidase (beta-lactamase class C family)